MTRRPRSGWPPPRWRAPARTLAGTGADCAFTEVRHIDERGEPCEGEHTTWYDTWLGGLDDYPALGFSLLRNNGARTSSNFFFTARLVERIGLFRPFTLVHDWDFLLRALWAGEPVVVREPLLDYRVHSAGTLVGNGSEELVAYEYSAVVSEYFRRARARGVPNILAPSPSNWPGYFDAFVGAESTLADAHRAFPTLGRLWGAVAAEPPPPRDPLTPPADLVTLVGSTTAEHYHAVAEEFFRHFVELGGLGRRDDVLDIGCGSGRMAVRLARHLAPSARYVGFDVVPEAVAWCSTEVSPRYPNFDFHVANVQNSFYSPGAAAPAAQYHFPHPDESFDFVFLTSVFTHMLPEDVDHYLAEISRVLRVGGRCLATFFLATGQSLELLRDGRGTLPFPHQFDGYRLHSADSPEFAVCYDEQVVLDLFGRHGLVVSGAPAYGNWCGRAEATSYQDIVVATRR